MAFNIHLQAGYSNHSRLGCTVRFEPAKHGPHSGHEFAKTNRFGDVVVGTRLQRPHHVILRISYSDHQYPNFGCQGANLTAGFHSADSRHVDVEEYKINSVLEKDVNCFFSATCLLDHKTAGSQRSPQHFAQGWLIIDNQNMRWE